MYSSKRILRPSEQEEVEDFIPFEEIPRKPAADDVKKLFHTPVYDEGKKSSPVLADDFIDSTELRNGQDKRRSSPAGSGAEEAEALKDSASSLSEENVESALDASNPAASTDAPFSTEENGTPVSESEGTSRKDGSSFFDGQNLSQNAADTDEDGFTQSTELLRNTREKAEEILVSARKEAEAIREKASQDGYNAGFEKGRELGRKDGVNEIRSQYEAEITKLQTEVDAAVKSVEEAKRQTLSKYLNELRDIAISVGEKVIHVSLRSSGEVIKRMILNEAEKMHKTSWLKIYIDKADYDMLLQTDSDMASELSRVSDNIKFVILDQDSEGNVILETPEERIDMGVGTQLENLRERLSQIDVGESSENHV